MARNLMHIRARRFAALHDLLTGVLGFDGGQIPIHPITPVGQTSLHSMVGTIPNMWLHPTSGAAIGLLRTEV